MSARRKAAEAALWSALIAVKLAVGFGFAVYLDQRRVARNRRRWEQ